MSRARAIRPTPRTMKSSEDKPRESADAVDESEKEAGARQATLWQCSAPSIRRTCSPSGLSRGEHHGPYADAAPSLGRQRRPTRKANRRKTSAAACTKRTRTKVAHRTCNSGKEGTRERRSPSATGAAHAASRRAKRPDGDYSEEGGAVNWSTRNTGGFLSSIKRKRSRVISRRWPIEVRKMDTENSDKGSEPKKQREAEQEDEED